MDPKESVFGDCHTATGAFEIGRFAERLFLFDRLVLRSYRLVEIPALCRVLGPEKVAKLLNSERLSLDCNTYGLGTTQLPGGRVLIQIPRLADHEERGKRWIKGALDAIPDLRQRQRQTLGDAIERRLRPLPEDFGSMSLSEARRTILARSPAIRTAALLAAEEIGGLELPDNLAFQVHVDDDGAYRVESNLTKLGVDSELAQRIEHAAVGAVGATELKLEHMRIHRSIAAFRERDVALLREKLRSVWETVSAGEMDAKAQTRRFDRVLQLKGLPDFQQAATSDTLDFQRLLDVRESDEWVAFRRWLRTTDAIADEEIAARMSSVRERIGTFLRTPIGKTLRIALTSIANAASDPNVSYPAGVALNFADSFLVEHIFPRGGPHAFLDDQVRPLVKPDPPSQ